MALKRMDNMGIVVESLDTAIAFFTELGMKLEGRVRWTQCQAQLLGQFSVWVPPLTLLKRLTPGLKARVGRSHPGRGGCAPPAPKKCD